MHVIVFVYIGCVYIGNVVPPSAYMPSLMDARLCKLFSVFVCVCVMYVCMCSKNNSVCVCVFV